MFGDEFSRIQVNTTGAKINLVHGGAGYPLLLLHGFPQTHFMWHRVAPFLSGHFHVICPDLRGYGDSAKPESSPDHYPYSKRVMAQDMINVMDFLGYHDFFVGGHDRGARVVHRMVLDHPERIKKASVMDIVPTRHMLKTTDQNFATGYYHWFFLIQPDGLPERLIGNDPNYYVTEKLKRWSGPDSVFSDSAIAQYVRCFSIPESIHAACEDYRAGASIDLKHDSEDQGQKIRCPLLVLWGGKSFVNQTYDVLRVWGEYAENIEGCALECGHFLPEEAPESVCNEFLKFFAGN
tara:strand:- start:42 stop:920 length:879 start_codon:yes stop_codon:yes gene_type:complete